MDSYFYDNSYLYQKKICAEKIQSCKFQMYICFVSNQQNITENFSTQKIIMSKQNQTKREISAKKCYYTGPPVEVWTDEPEPKRKKTDAEEKSESHESNWYECTGGCIDIGGYGIVCDTCGHDSNHHYNDDKLTEVEVKKRLKMLRADQRLI